MYGRAGVKFRNRISKKKKKTKPKNKKKKKTPKETTKKKKKQNQISRVLVQRDLWNKGAVSHAEGFHNQGVTCPES